MDLQRQFKVETRGGELCAVFKDKGGTAHAFTEEDLRAHIKQERGGGKTPSHLCEALHEIQREKGIQPSAKRTPTGGLVS